MLMNFDLPFTIDFLLMWQEKIQLFADVAIHS
jgi:hypothetical protein